VGESSAAGSGVGDPGVAESGVAALPETVAGLPLLEVGNEDEKEWRPGWALVAGVVGLLGGPSMLILVFGAKKWLAYVVGPPLLAVCFGALNHVGIEWKRWSIKQASLRSGVVLVAGAVPWILEVRWSIPGSAVPYHMIWPLLLTVPFTSASIAVNPEARRVTRIVCATVLIGVVCLWPVFRILAATEIRHHSHVPAHAWFLIDADGYATDPYHLRPDGIAEIDYYRDFGGGVQSETVDLELLSWPIAGDVVCASDADKTWSSLYRDGQYEIARRGSRCLALGLPSRAFPLDLSQLPGILATAHIAGDDEVLKIANGS
jgi:uncharacterized membrane protein HdeD (DUF308 family)